MPTWGPMRLMAFRLFRDWSTRYPEKRRKRFYTAYFLNDLRDRNVDIEGVPADFFDPVFQNLHRLQKLSPESLEQSIRFRPGVGGRGTFDGARLAAGGERVGR